MNIFGSKLGILSARSAEAIGVFTKAVNKLEGINQELSAEQDKNQTEINKLNDENIQLAIVETENRKIIHKIETFLSTED